jgi:hypothetical protein
MLSKPLSTSVALRFDCPHPALRADFSRKREK